MRLLQEVLNFWRGIASALNLLCLGIEQIFEIPRIRSYLRWFTTETVAVATMHDMAGGHHAWHGRTHGHDTTWPCMSWHVMTWHGHAWHDMSCHDMSCHDMAMTCHDMTWPWHDMTWHVMSWHGHDMSCHDMVMHVMTCHGWSGSAYGGQHVLCSSRRNKKNYRYLYIYTYFPLFGLFLVHMGCEANLFFGFKLSFSVWKGAGNPIQTKLEIWIEFE